MNNNKKSFKSLLLYIGIPIIIILIIAAVWNSGPKDNHKYSDIVGFFRDEKVSSYTINLGTGEMQISLKDSGEVINYTAPSVGLMYEDSKDYGAKYIITRNIDDYKKSEIKAILPSDFLDEELMH